MGKKWDKTRENAKLAKAIKEATAKGKSDDERREAIDEVNKNIEEGKKHR